jgi:hypothetical protein
LQRRSIKQDRHHHKQRQLPNRVVDEFWLLQEILSNALPLVRAAVPEEIGPNALLLQDFG